MNDYEPNLLKIGWPSVGPQPQNPALVRSLFTMYAGRYGELTSIIQYFYNSLLCVNQDMVELGDFFGAASRDAMFHLKRLGQLILQYGGDPRLLSYQNGRQVWWSSGAVSYQKDPIIMLRQAIEQQKRVIEEYKQIEARMEPEPRAMIQRILLDENHYLDLFQRILHDMENPKT